MDFGDTLRIAHFFGLPARKKPTSAAKPARTARPAYKRSATAVPTTGSSQRPKRTSFKHLADSSSPIQDADKANDQEPAVPCDMCDGTGTFGGEECQTCDGEGSVTAQQAQDKADEILNAGKIARRAATGIPTPKAGSLASQILAAGERARGK